jgi:hypothetical protein
LAWNRGFAGAELNRLARLTEANEARLLERWNDYFDLDQ